MVDPTEEESKLGFFAILNEDCVYALFDHLKLDELCAVNGTCKTLRELAGKYFRRKYPELVARRVI